jgi:hypothetical protein
MFLTVGSETEIEFYIPSRIAVFTSCELGLACLVGVVYTACHILLYFCHCTASFRLTEHLCSVATTLISMILVLLGYMVRTYYLAPLRHSFLTVFRPACPFGLCYLAHISSIYSAEPLAPGYFVVSRCLTSFECFLAYYGSVCSALLNH